MHPSPNTREATSFCRICAGLCALRLTIEDERIVAARGDKSNPLTQGYACIKGLTAHEAQYSPDRILHPLKRRPDGGFERIGLEQALDEIAERVQSIIGTRWCRCDRRIPRHDELFERHCELHVAGLLAGTRFTFVLFHHDRRSIGKVDHGRAPGKLGRRTRCVRCRRGPDVRRYESIGIAVDFQLLSAASGQGDATVQSAWRQVDRDRSTPHRNCASRRCFLAAVSR